MNASSRVRYTFTPRQAARSALSRTSRSVVPKELFTITSSNRADSVKSPAINQ